MKVRELWIVVGLLVAVLWLSGIVLAWPAQATDPPLFQRDHTYVVAWDCWPDWSASWAGANLAGGHALNPCYAEQLTVTAIRADGWLDVQDEGGNSWRVNPARMMGVQEAGSPSIRAAK